MSAYDGAPSAFSAGLRCRCPRCGKGPMFDGYLTTRERCEVCGLEIAAHDSGDGPAVFIIFILGALVVPMALMLESAISPPLWVHGIIWGIVILGGSIGLLRPFKGVLIALQYHHQTPDQ